MNDVISVSGNMNLVWWGDHLPEAWRAFNNSESADFKKYLLVRSQNLLSSIRNWKLIFQPMDYIWNDYIYVGYVNPHVDVPE